MRFYTATVALGLLIWSFALAVAKSPCSPDSPDNCSSCLEAPPDDAAKRGIEFIDCKSEQFMRTCGPTCTEGAKKKLRDAIGGLKKDIEKAPKK
jgi:hypothetical protein